MEIKKDKSKIKIVGHAARVNDWLTFQNVVSDALLDDSGPVEIEIVDTPIISSSIIGFLLKTIHVDKADISLRVNDARLYEHLRELNLIHALKVNIGIPDRNQDT